MGGLKTRCWKKNLQNIGLLNAEWGFFEQILKNQNTEEKEGMKDKYKRLENSHILAFV